MGDQTAKEMIGGQRLSDLSRHIHFLHFVPCQHPDNHHVKPKGQQGQSVGKIFLFRSYVGEGRLILPGFLPSKGGAYGLRLRGN